MNIVKNACILKENKTMKHSVIKQEVDIIDLLLTKLNDNKALLKKKYTTKTTSISNRIERLVMDLYYYFIRNLQQEV